jgi:homoserine O-acetyltransferase
MNDSCVIFDSSDAARSAAPLPFAQSVTLPDPITLEHADTLSRVTIVYETYGTLNPARDNAILICHALSGDSHVARHNDTDADGWWDLAVGPGKAIDTDRFFVICPNILGGCRGTTGPNAIDPATGKRYAGDFPVVTIADTVEVQKRLLDHLGIERLHAVIGGSMGGQQAMVWATRHPDRVANCVLIATATRLTSQALAFDIVARNAITRDPHFYSGDYYDKPHGPTVGLALARMLGHITYLSREAMTARFDPGRLKPRQLATAFENRFSVGGYLAYQGEKFVERFDANSYLTLSMMLDLFDFGSTPEEIERSFSTATCRFLVISFTSDWLFTPQQSRQMVEALVRLGKRVSSCDVPSDGGHDAFLLADGVAKFGGLLSGFLSPATHACNSSSGHKPRAARQAQRLDHQAIRDLLPAGASVLDLGCGEGELLDSLTPARAYRIGLELDVPALIAAVTHGQDVVHADLNDSLAFFRDQQFEVVVLSQALQCVRDTQRILEEITRIGRRAIVSFPNFAHRDLRRMFAEQGRVPKSPGAFGYDWYDTPNRRFPSILDVQELCDSMGIKIVDAIYLDRTTQVPVSDDPNLNATEAVFVLVKDNP